MSQVIFHLSSMERFGTLPRVRVEGVGFLLAYNFVDNADQVYYTRWEHLAEMINFAIAEGYTVTIL